MRARHRLASTLAVAALAAAVRVLASCAESGGTPTIAYEAGVVPETGSLVAPAEAGAVETCVGDAWCALTLPVSPLSLNGVWGAAADDVWVVASPDLTLHWDGARIATAPLGTRQTPFGVWGSGKSDVWAFSAGNAMWHSEGFGDGGAVWSSYDGGGDASTGWSSAIAAMWGRGPDDVWAVGPFSSGNVAPPLWHCDGWHGGAPSWSPVPTSAADPPDFEPLSFNAIWGSDAEIWVVGDGGKTRIGTRGDGGATWRAQNSATSMDLHAVWGASKDDVRAAGAGGTMRRFTRAASGWNVESLALPTVASINALAGTSPDDVWAAGDQGTLLHWDGHAWSPIALPVADAVERDLYALWIAPGGDVWVAGRNTLLHKRASAEGGAP